MKKIKLLSILICFAVTMQLDAQVVTDEMPPSFYQLQPDKSVAADLSLQVPNKAKLKAQDRVEDEIKDIPWRFGVEQKVDIDFSKAGKWVEDGQGNSKWIYRIKGKSAKSLNLNFSRFHLSESARLFVYNADYSDVLGAITSANNKENKEFAIRPIQGNAIALELHCKTSEKEEIEIKIEGIVYGYRSIRAKAAKTFGSSGSCNININCVEGDNWQDIKRSIVLILRSNNTRWCSGSLLNNVRQDSVPYVLSANHCGLQTNSIFIFNYESPNCAPNSDGNLSRSISGCLNRSTMSSSDFHLMQLSTKPPASYEVFYAGWDARNVASTLSTGIHHPSGDVMKICVDDDNTVTSGYYASGTTHWKVENWERGTTEGGSSGSPLFNQLQRVVGQLHGGNAACGNSAEDYYGKFSVSWNQNTSASAQLKAWLDPDNTGTVVLDGLDTKTSSLNRDAGFVQVSGIPSFLCNDSLLNPTLIVKNNGNALITTMQISYSVGSGASNNFNWSGSLAKSQSIGIPIPNLLAQSGNNAVQFNIASVNGIASDDDINNNSFSTSAFANIQPIYATLKLKTDDYGDETSWLINQQVSGIEIASGGGYAQISGGAVYTESLCLYDTCFNFVLMDSYGDGFNGSFGNGYALITDNMGDTLVYEANFTSAIKNNSFCVLNSNTGISETKENRKYSLYPNPILAGDRLNFEAEQLLDISIFDISGKLLLESVQTNSMQLPNEMAPGVYLIKGKSKSGAVILQEKLIVH